MFSAIHRSEDVYVNIRNTTDHKVLYISRAVVSKLACAVGNQ